MTNQRVARGQHAAQASRILPIKRGERGCPQSHDNPSIREGASCPACRAVK